jgi:hypothetical protein
MRLYATCNTDTGACDHTTHCLCAPVTLKLVPVAAPMLGVVRFAPALTEILPWPSKAVVLLSTLAENTVPMRLKPAEVLAL